LVVVAAVELEKVFFVKANAESKGTQDSTCGFKACPVERGHEGLELRHGRGGKPDIGLIWVVVGADLIAFLLVTSVSSMEVSIIHGAKESDLAICDLSQLLHHLLVVFLAERCRHFLESRPRVTSMVRPARRMWCFQLLFLR
jgi:hypothetical protein